jgi:hypothetical protein
MNMQIETTSSEIKSYEEYLSAFFPQFVQNKNDEVVTAKEIGIQMAEETLTRIRDLLVENKPA